MIGKLPKHFWDFMEDGDFDKFAKRENTMKAITQQQKLEAFALYTLATQHYRKCREFEAAASAILGPDESDEFNSFVSDGIYGSHHDRPMNFDEILKRAGIVVTKEQKTGPKKKPRK